MTIMRCPFLIATVDHFTTNPNPLPSFSSPRTHIARQRSHHVNRESQRVLHNRIRRSRIVYIMSAAAHFVTLCLRARLLHVAPYRPQIRTRRMRSIPSACPALPAASAAPLNFPRTLPRRRRAAGHQQHAPPYFFHRFFFLCDACILHATHNAQYSHRHSVHGPPQEHR